MLVFELAIQKYRDDLKDNKIEINPNLPEYCYYTNKDSFSTINYGETRQAYWLLTGNPYSKIEYDGIDSIDKILNAFRKNPEISLLDVELKNDTKITDIYGNEVLLFGAHAYGVKSIDDNYIKLVNSAYSNQEIIIEKNMLKELPLLDLVFCQLED